MVTRFKAYICSGDMANLEVYVDSYIGLRGFVGYSILKAKLQFDTWIS